MRREEHSSVDIPVVDFPSAVGQDEMHFLELRQTS
jgi:hypothetical protein